MKNLFRHIAIATVIIIIFPQIIKAQEQPVKRPTIGLVLSGGAAKGFAHIGVLKVLEELGIYPDYIAGTSMGSLVGGLYASGYNTSMLVTMVKKQDWNDILTDKYNRRNLSTYEKEQSDRIFVPVAIRDNKAKISLGLMSGQKVHRLLADMTWNVYKDTLFADLPIPFFCAATNIENGKVEYLDHGNLADALRASMAIPSVFDPVIIGGKMLVDGGLVDNFPVIEMKKRFNPDIIIGVDVGYTSKSKEDLSSLTKILEQVIFNPSVPFNNENEKVCNILIKPNLNGYGTTNFNDADSIIACGERSTRAIYGQLKALADSLRNIAPMNKAKLFKNVDTIQIDEVIVEGLKKIPPQVILRKLNLEIPGKVSIKELDEGVNDAYSTLLFESINYELKYDKGYTILVVRARETYDATFSVGVRYDNDLKTGVLLSAETKNVIFKGTKFTLDVVIGDNPRLSTNYLFYSNWGGSKNRSKSHWFSPDFGFKLDTRTIPLFTYDSNEKRSQSFNYSVFSGDIYFRNNINSFHSISIGTSFEFSSVTANINPLDFERINYQVGSAYFNYRLDAMDDYYYPTKGMYMNVDVKIINDIANLGYFAGYGYIKWLKPIKFGKRFAMIPSTEAGTVYGDYIPLSYQFYVGGSGYNYYRGCIPFMGLDYLELTDESFWKARLDLRVRIFKKIFITAKLNVGQTCDKLFANIEKSEFLYGGGLSLSYKSIIGPIEFCWVPRFYASPMYYFSLGYQF